MSKVKFRETLFEPKTCVWISVFVNLILTVFKFFAGIIGLSNAMVSDALHSLSDILTSVVVYVGIHIAEQPADDDHPYGHGNAETIAAGLVSIVIFAIGIYAGISAILTISRGQFNAPLAIAGLAAIISIIVKEVLFRYTLKVGRISENPAIVADAWHHRSDVYSSLAALAGIVGAKISFLYLDPLAGIAVSGFIISISFRIIRQNVRIMMDAKPNEAFINNIEVIVQDISGVEKIDNIKVHRRGSQFTIDLEISVDSRITVEAGHKIASDVRERLFERINHVYEVMVHVNPA